MAYRTRTYYTDSQKALMWERWRQGWTLHQIAQLFDRAHTSVQKILSRTGGIRPPERSRSSMALTLAEREEISRALAAGFDSLDRVDPRASSIYHQPRAQAQWWSRVLSGDAS